MRIRKACTPDSIGIARVRVDTWRTAYTGIVPASHLSNLRYETIKEQFDAVFIPENGYHIYVAEDETRRKIVGFILAGANRNGKFAYQSEIYALYVLKEHEGRGIGRALLKAMIADLRSAGAYSTIIWVLTNNPYRRFYEKLGGIIAGTDVFAIDGLPLPITGYGWSDNGNILAEKTGQSQR